MDRDAFFVFDHDAALILAHRQTCLYPRIGARQVSWILQIVDISFRMHLGEPEPA